jgi:hypothetical protein
MDLDNDYLWDNDDSSQVNDNDNQQTDSEFVDYYGDDDDQHDDDQKDDKSQPTDYLSRLLRARGVDRSKVKIENEDGDIEEWNFDDLDDDTKFGILSMNPNEVLSDVELQDLEFLRKNRMNLKDFAKYQKDQAVKEYLEQNQSVTYTVDQLSDDELYKFDLKDQMPDLTDEEIEEQLSRVKENEAFFQKKISALRKEYKDLEDEQKQQEDAKIQAEQEEQFNQLAQSLVTSARNIDEMNGMELDDSDKNEVLSYLLDRDANGQSQFSKLFEDPDALFKMAWFMLKGQEAHEALTDYYKNEISKARRANKQEPKKVIKRAKQTDDSDLYDLDSVFKK